MKFIPPLITIIGIALASQAYAVAPFTSAERSTLTQYLFANLLSQDNILKKDDQGGVINSLPGAVLASPTNHGQQFSQDYQFHWVRDAALSMQEVVRLYEMAEPQDKPAIKSYLLNYVLFERRAQEESVNHGMGLGEPKFNIDGTVYRGDWGRPQNDGPALRAITFVMIANSVLAEDEKWIKEKIIPGLLLDLDYVNNNWRNGNFDLWEEVYDADHFFTKMVQRKALEQGATFLNRFGDEYHPAQYRATALELTRSLEKHWNEGRGYFSETIYQQANKGGGLDSSILLGVLAGDLNNDSNTLAVTDPRVMSSIFYLRNSFSGLYRINVANHHAPVLIGRYANDMYDGDQSLYGNPWVLTTNALAQYYYALANAYLTRGIIEITPVNLLFFQQVNAELFNHAMTISLKTQPHLFYQAISSLFGMGDEILTVVKQYGTCYSDLSCLHFAEQIDRSNGKAVSANDLSWNYATFLAAMRERSQVEKALRT